MAVPGSGQGTAIMIWKRPRTIMRTAGRIRCTRVAGHTEVSYHELTYESAPAGDTEPYGLQSKREVSMTRPDFIRHWTELEDADDNHYPGDTELMAIGAPLARKLGLTRIGIHHNRLPPGRRTSYPHAESAEEEFVLVLEGTPDVWIDGELHRLGRGA